MCPTGHSCQYQVPAGSTNKPTDSSEKSQSKNIPDGNRHILLAGITMQEYVLLFCEYAVSISIPLGTCNVPFSMKRMCK